MTLVLSAQVKEKLDIWKKSYAISRIKRETES